MTLADIIKEIKSLPRYEKLQLIEAISKMLLEEENPERYIASEEDFEQLGRWFLEKDWER